MKLALEAHRVAVRFCFSERAQSYPTQGGAMSGEVKQVGSRTYRESFGRYFEDFKVGDIYQHRPGRTITQYDNISFTLLTMNTHPMHFDEEYARHSEFGRCIVCSPLTVALMVGMSVTDVSQKAIANLGWTDIKLTHPLFAGDTLYAESEVLDKRESKSRPGAGIVSVKTVGLNQEGVKVCEFNRAMLIMKRSGNDVEVKANY
jgi:acyl dehydratase